MSQHAPNIPNGKPRETSRHAPDAHRHVDDDVGGMSEPLRLTVDEAAKLLGTSANALRKRIERGTIRSEKVDGVRYVLLSDSDMPQHADDAYTSMSHDSAAPSHDSATGMSAFVTSLEDQVSYLREQLDKEREANRENRRLLAAALERIPELEPAREASPELREFSPTASQQQGNGTAYPEEEGLEKRSWWRRLLDLE
jgi:excisionase family DNA binding protein